MAAITTQHSGRKRRSDSDTTIRIAELIERGAPFGERGYHEPEPPDLFEQRARVELAGSVDEPPRDELNAEEGACALAVVTGLLDDRRRLLRPGETFYGVARFARRWQDTWTPEEHEDFWAGALSDWPSPGGKQPHRMARAFAVVVALERRLDLHEFLRRLSAELRTRPSRRGLAADEFTMAEFERLDILGLANRMISAPRTFLRHDDLGRLPRVVTLAELEQVGDHVVPEPGAPLSEHSTAGAASREIVDAAHKVADEMTAAAA